MPIGELVSRLVAESRELAHVEIARARALVADRGRVAVRAAALAMAALVFAVIGVAALAAAAVFALAALGLAAGWAAAIVGVLLAVGAAGAGLGVRSSAKELLHPMPGEREIERGREPPRQLESGRGREPGLTGRRAAEAAGSASGVTGGSP